MLARHLADHGWLQEAFMNPKASDRRTRRTLSAPFKAKVALAAVREDKTLAELPDQYELHPTQINEGRCQLHERAVQVFEARRSGARGAPEVDLSPLHAKIGQLALENNFLERALNKAGLLSAKR